MIALDGLFLLPALVRAVGSQVLARGRSENLTKKIKKKK
jgi:hypothetical protein